MPPAEVMLWKRLRSKQVAGIKFRRQHGIDQFILDFYCPEVHLSLEIDDESHHTENTLVYDARRQQSLQAQGITVLRFSNQQIYEQLDAVVETIWMKVEALRAEKGLEPTD